MSRPHPNDHPLMKTESTLELITALVNKIEDLQDYDDTNAFDRRWLMFHARALINVEQLDTFETDFDSYYDAMQAFEARFTPIVEAAYPDVKITGTKDFDEGYTIGGQTIYGDPSLFVYYSDAHFTADDNQAVTFAARHIMHDTDDELLERMRVGMLNNSIDSNHTLVYDLCGDLYDDNYVPDVEQHMRLYKLNKRNNAEGL